MENNLAEIKEFIAQWKTKAKVYYNELIQECEKEYETAYAINEYYRHNEAVRKLVEKYSRFVIDLSHGYSPKDREERLNKFIEKEAEAKERTLIARVNKAVGTILGAEDLYVGVNGELNGRIKGENGTCEIETIYAGGYNIQCLHYRVLVKKIKEVR